MASKDNRTLERVCVVTSTFADGAGQVLLSNFLRVLEPLCEKVFVITGAFEDEGKSGKINIIRLNPHDDKRTTIKILKFIGSQVKMCLNLMRIRKNITTVMLYINATGLTLPLVFSKVLRKRTVLIVSGSDSLMAGMIYQNYLFGIGGKVIAAIYKALGKINYYFSDRIIIDSERLIADSGLKRNPDKIIVAGGRRFIESDIFRVKKLLAERRNLVGYIGRLSYEKGVMNLAKAIPLALRQRDDLDFLIGGDGPLLTGLKDEITQANLDNKVKFTGWISHNELADCLNELKLLVLPSSTEGLPNTVLEAMACGTPVLVTPVGTLPEIIKDKETGFIMEDNSPDSIAKGIVAALSYPHLDKVARDAQTLVENRFNFQAAVKRYRDILRSLDER